MGGGGGKSCVNVFTESHAAAETVKWSRRLTLFFLKHHGRPEIEFSNLIR